MPTNQWTRSCCQNPKEFLRETCQSPPRALSMAKFWAYRLIQARSICPRSSQRLCQQGWGTSKSPLRSPRKKLLRAECPSRSQTPSSAVELLSISSMGRAFGCVAVQNTRPAAGHFVTKLRRHNVAHGGSVCEGATDGETRKRKKSGCHQRTRGGSPSCLSVLGFHERVVCMIELVGSGPCCMIFAHVRVATDMPKPIQRVKFTKAIARHTKIRDQNPSLGYICPGEPHERSPNAPKFEDRSQEGTEWQEHKVPAKQRGS